MSATCDRKRYCRGCRNDFYNGNNDLGVSECWSLKTATVVWKRFVWRDQMPPWTNKPERTLSCHHRSGYIGVDPKVTQ